MDFFWLQILVYIFNEQTFFVQPSRLKGEYLIYLQQLISNFISLAVKFHKVFPLITFLHYQQKLAIKYHSM